jgi:hypothetical protein
MTTTATTVEGAIREVLLADAGVGSLIGDRIRPFTDPASIPMPKLTYQRWGTAMDVAAGGFTNDGPTGFKVAKIQLDAWAADLLTAGRVAGAVERCLNGTVIPGTGVNILCARVNDVREQPATLIPGREKPPQRITLDLRVTYQENS